MKRKLFSLLLAVFMVLTAVPIYALAENPDIGVDLDNLYKIQFTVESVTADLNSDTVDVSILVEKNGGFAGVMYQLMYDNSVLSLESDPVLGELSGFELVSGPLDTSYHLAMLSSKTNVFGDGVLVTYTFKVNPEADAGTYDITLVTSGQTSDGVALEVLDASRNPVASTVVNGSVTIPGFTVAYDANGGTGAPASVTKSNGKDVTISAKAPIRTGFNFLGWATSADAKQAEYVAGDVYSQNADVTLYAVWEKIVISPGTAVLEVETAEGKIGEEVAVEINITSNPGIGSMGFNVVYDNTALELVSYENPFNSTMSAIDRYENMVTVGYVNLDNAIGDSTNYTGNFITLNFKVKDTAADGLASVKIVPSEDDFYKHDGPNREPVDIAVQVIDGGVVVGSELLGDINLDEFVDMNDAILLLQYSMFPDLYPIGYKGSIDFTKDGNVDMNDAILLLQYSMFPDLYPIA